MATSNSANKPLISVLVTVFKGMPLLPRTVQAIQAQTYDHWELIIVDDHSEDDSMAYLKSIQHEKIKVFVNPDKGRGTALNYGLTQCKGKYIAINDADDVSVPERFALQVAFLEQNLEYGLVGANFIKIFPDGKLDYSDKDTQNELLRKKLSLHSCIQHSTVMVKSELMEKIGRYNLNIKFMYDRDMYIRIAAISKIANLSEHLVYINQHENQFFLNTYKGWLRLTYQIRYSNIAISLLHLPVSLYFINTYIIAKHYLKTYIKMKVSKYIKQGNK